jgi:PEP-CTERM motif
MTRKLAMALTLAAFLTGATGQVQADLVTWTTGDLGNNVIFSASGGTFTVNPDLVNPSNADPASLDVKYGLWDSPVVPVDVFLNSVLVGSFVANSGYISPGPQFITLDVTGLLLPGLNDLEFVGSGTGDYVIGQVDLTYNSLTAPVPEPSTLAIAGTAIVGSLVVARRRKPF